MLHTKLRTVQSLHKLFLIKYMDILEKYDSNECVALFYSDEKYEWIFDRVRYAIMLKSNVS